MDICIDTRKLKPGQIFIPIKGPNFDGHDFIEDAIKKGAQILDVDLESYAKKYRKKLKCHVIGITGSAGKTTAKDMLYFILSQKFNVIRTEENENNEIGVPLTLLKADSTTDILIIEMGMRQRGEIAHLTRIARPTHTVITSIGNAHIENLKTQRNIALAKSEIFQHPTKDERKNRYAFINFNTPYYDVLKNRAQDHGFKLLPFKGSTKIDQTLNLCYSVGQHFGLTESEIEAGLKQYQPSKHRMAIYDLKNITIIDDCYNANPDGVIYAMQHIKRRKGRKMLVLGDMRELGDKSKELHQSLIPEAIENEISCIFTLGPQSQHMQSEEVSVMNYLDRDTLHKELLSEIKQGDVILIKGSRGMKMEETVAFLMEKFKNE
jgi:UDP-N-acetylmuramoyl-tripeptide--D-alanyl-D-alanine ligase